MSQPEQTHASDHRELHGDALSAAAKASLESSGERWTGMRAEVFEELARHNRPVSAYDIADNLSAKRGSRVAANSVYRILDIFVHGNLAKRIESANAFLVNSHPGCRHDCVFLICDDCGTASHFDNDSITGALRQAGTAKGFTDVRPVVELRGLCAQCT